MSTPLTDSINALTAYANEVTGGSDTNLSDAVHTLASGYGGGGGTWKQKVISPSSDMSNAIDIKNWLLSEIGAASVAVVIRDDWYTDVDVMGTFLLTSYDNSQLGYWTRRRNGKLDSTTNWIASYSLYANSGDTYTVLYKE